MQAILSNNNFTNWERKEEEVFGDKIGLLATVFGCWHKNLGRPFTDGQKAYRSCMDCGARRHFSPDTLQTYGPFYFPPNAALTLKK
jgi:hypothetical protein